MRRALALVALLLAATGCDEEFKPATVVDKLRVLGVAAQPPEVRPGQLTALAGLIVDPSRAAPPSVFWIACDPDPYNLNRTACSNAANFTDSSALDLSSGALPAGMRLVGLNDRAAYAAPADTFEVLPAGDPRRVSGTVAQVLILAVADAVDPGASQEELAQVFARVQSKEVASLLALFRVQVSEKAAPNTNPRFERQRYGDDEPPPAAHLLLRPGEVISLGTTVAPESYEAYVEQTPTGREDKVERMQVAWYSTSGRFAFERFALDSALEQTFTAPAYDPRDVLPADRRGTTWAVLRDSRGGFAWREQPFYLCDQALPRPALTRATAPASPGAPLVLEGEHLENAVDVLVGGVVVQGGYSAARGTWEGVPRAVAAGTWPVELRSADCSMGPGGVSVLLP